MVKVMATAQGYNALKQSVRDMDVNARVISRKRVSR
jgi:hypothetical protein